MDTHVSALHENETELAETSLSFARGAGNILMHPTPF